MVSSSYKDTFYKDKIKDLEDEIERKNKLTKFIEQKTLTGYWQWTQKTDTVVWSPQVFKCFNLEFDLETRTLDSYLNLIHPEDLDKVKASIENYKNTNNEFKHRLRLKSNPLKILEGYGSVETDIETGVVRHFPSLGRI